MFIKKHLIDSVNSYFIFAKGNHFYDAMDQTTLALVHNRAPDWHNGSIIIAAG
jgi:hypothetical protein